jgi:hypothetical protein
MELDELNELLAAEDIRRSKGGKTTFEELMDEASRIRSTGDIQINGGVSALKDTAYIYHYKGTEIVGRTDVVLYHADKRVWEDKIIEAQFHVSSLGFIPVSRLPQAITGIPCRKTKEELEYDKSQDSSNEWSSKNVPISGSYVIGDGPVKVTEDVKKSDEDPEIVEYEAVSKSKPGQVHRVSVKNGVVLSCTCEGNSAWHRKCHHMKEIQAKLDKQ